MSIEKYTAYTGMIHFYSVYKHHEILYMNCVVGDVPQLLTLVKPYTVGFTMCIYPRSTFFTHYVLLHLVSRSQTAFTYMRLPGALISK